MHFLIATELSVSYQEAHDVVSPSIDDTKFDRLVIVVSVLAYTATLPYPVHF
jgi:hypothetical protein